MESTHKKPHAVCIPFPAQGHINPMLKLAKILHFKGFHITFVHTDFNYQRLIKSIGEDSMEPADDFQFRSVSDGLPSSNQRGILEIPDLCESLSIHCKKSFREVIVKINGSTDLPPVSCIVADGVMSFTLEVAQEFGIPEILFFTPSACGVLGYLHFGDLKQRGYFPLKDERYLTNGYLDTVIDWIPAMRGIRLKDLPTFIRTTNPKDTMFNVNLQAINNALDTKSSIIINTFDGLEQQVLEAIRIKFPGLYTIGPLAMLHDKIQETKLHKIGSSLWKEDKKCLEWLENKEPGSVLYVNFGSLVIMTDEQLREFAWGLANTNYPFLWVIRPNLVQGGDAIQSREFLKEIEGNGLILEWCPQEKVLGHASIGGFLTHCGWNSTLESVAHGVPMLCWPFFADQQMNCHYICHKWGIGMEIDVDVKRKDVEGLVRELMVGGKGKNMRENAIELKILAERATNPEGSSYINLDKLVNNLKRGSICNLDLVSSASLEY